jgi:hypothetical protein
MNDTERRRKEIIHAKYLNGIMNENWSKERADAEEDLYKESIKDNPSWGAGWVLMNKIGEIRLKEQNKL